MDEEEGMGKGEAAVAEWITCIGLSEGQRDRLEKVCKDIHARDPSFRFDLRPSAFPKYAWVVLIYSKTESQAHRRGLWIRAKVDPSVLYWVKERRILRKAK
jgi:hypothetical protein